MKLTGIRMNDVISVIDDDDDDDAQCETMHVY